MSSTKRGALSQTLDSKNLKKKIRVSEFSEIEFEEGGQFEESADGSHMEEDMQGAPPPPGFPWDWNRCFVYDCRRNSDR